MRRFIFVFSFCSILFIQGCLDFSGDLTRKRLELALKKEALEKSLIKDKPLFTERETLMQELRQTEAEIEQIKAYLGQNGEKK